VILIFVSQQALDFFIYSRYQYIFKKFKYGYVEKYSLTKVESENKSFRLFNLFLINLYTVWSVFASGFNFNINICCLQNIVHLKETVPVPV
jgi:hypothetical protein